MISSETSETVGKLLNIVLKALPFTKTRKEWCENKVKPIWIEVNEDEDEDETDWRTPGWRSTEYLYLDGFILKHELIGLSVIFDPTDVDKKLIDKLYCLSWFDQMSVAKFENIPDTPNKIIELYHAYFMSRKKSEQRLRLENIIAKNSNKVNKLLNEVFLSMPCGPEEIRGDKTCLHYYKGFVIEYNNVGIAVRFDPQYVDLDVIDKYTCIVINSFNTSVKAVFENNSDTPHRIVYLYNVFKKNYLTLNPEV